MVAWGGCIAAVAVVEFARTCELTWGVETDRAKNQGTRACRYCLPLSSFLPSGVASISTSMPTPPRTLTLAPRSIRRRALWSA